MYTVDRTPYFERQVRRLHPEKQKRVERIERALKQEITGKPLRYDFFREKRLNGERVLFLVYECAIVMVLITDKKAQQEDIDRILLQRERFRQFISG